MHLCKHRQTSKNSLSEKEKVAFVFLEVFPKQKFRLLRHAGIIPLRKYRSELDDELFHNEQERFQCNRYRDDTREKGRAGAKLCWIGAALGADSGAVVETQGSDNPVDFVAFLKAVAEELKKSESGLR